MYSFIYAFYSLLGPIFQFWFSTKTAPKHHRKTFQRKTHRILPQHIIPKTLQPSIFIIITIFILNTNKAPRTYHPNDNRQFGGDHQQPFKDKIAQHTQKEQGQEARQHHKLPQQQQQRSTSGSMATRATPKTETVDFLTPIDRARYVNGPAHVAAPWSLRRELTDSKGGQWRAFRSRDRGPARNWPDFCSANVRAAFFNVFLFSIGAREMRIARFFGVDFFFVSCVKRDRDFFSIDLIRDWNFCDVNRKLNDFFYIIIINAIYF